MDMKPVCLLSKVFCKHKDTVSDKEKSGVICQIFCCNCDAVYISIPTKILMCQCVPKKSAVLACLTMAKLKINRHVPNKSAEFAEKNQLNGNRGVH